MLKHKHIDKICLGMTVIMILITVLFMNGEFLGIEKMSRTPQYKAHVFSNDKVHRIDLKIDPKDWRDMLANPQEKEYMRCDITIDGETAKNAAVRTKGNNSLSLTEEYDSVRYGLKIEFDHYDASNTFLGLDKLALNPSFQDNAYMKEYMTYKMMEKMGVASPLCSFADIRVNGERIGLYVAIEEPEESFARRNYGNNYGKLYKPGYKNIDDPNLDVALIYTDEKYSSYDNLFRTAKFDITDRDKDRLIASLKKLDAAQDLEEAVDVDQVIRYFVVQSFVVNWDSYLGATGHNYYLHEKGGKLSMIPWDYNLAYATYPLGMPDPIDDTTYFVNNPINTPNKGSIMLKRPMFHKLMSEKQYFNQYHKLYGEFIERFFDSGYFEKELSKTARMIAPYVKNDPTKFCSYEDHLLAVETFQGFCLLRAESVRGQLKGTIPASTKGQKQNPEALINADHLRVPDMGDMKDMRAAVWE